MSFAEGVLSACEWCLDQRNHQGWYGECFIRALGAAAGLQVSSMEPDCTGVDFDITAPREILGDFPCIKVQVKSWSVPRGTDAAWSYPGLTQKRFNALAGPRRIPRFLFIVVVPSDVTGYAHADEACLRLNHAAYWVSLASQQKIAEPQCRSKLTVSVPRTNLLTVDSLRKLCEETALSGGMTP
ncbi:DUF4365 domain-containing protein [Saccharopolyspora shandongensis]|uniref:DUF4365 domain-containing protein n=1 Tax=Saccharopolyspora shandongensis TaxID=418495 RepID=UPI0033CECD4F